MQVTVMCENYELYTYSYKHHVYINLESKNFM